jgi:hypothetical protein
MRLIVPFFGSILGSVFIFIGCSDTNDAPRSRTSGVTVDKVQSDLVFQQDEEGVTGTMEIDIPNIAYNNAFQDDFDTDNSDDGFALSSHSPSPSAAPMTKNCYYDADGNVVASADLAAETIPTPKNIGCYGEVVTASCAAGNATHGVYALCARVDLLSPSGENLAYIKLPNGDTDFPTDCSHLSISLQFLRQAASSTDQNYQVQVAVCAKPDAASPRPFAMFGMDAPRPFAAGTGYDMSIDLTPLRANVSATANFGW